MLADLVLTCGLIVLLAAVTVPGVQASRDRQVSRIAARMLAQRLQGLRVEAVRRNRSVAMRFDPTEVGRWGVYADGNGDGVSQRDIDRGVDPRLTPDAHLSHLSAGVGFRIAFRVPTPDGGGVADQGSDPLRIGNSNFVSFSPGGTATSGTIYLAGPDGRQRCVRIFGATGRVRVLWFDRTANAWLPD